MRHTFALVVVAMCLPAPGIASVVKAAEAKSQASGTPAATPSASKPVALLPDDSRRWSHVEQAVLLSDMSKAEPALAHTSGRREKGKWKTIPYAVEGWEGVALSTLRDTEAARARLPLGVKGPHAVYVGVCTTSMGLDNTDDNSLQVKLSSENVYSRVSCTLPLLKPRRDQIEEVFVTAADLTGQGLDIAPQPHLPSTLCYVKLVPLTAAEFAEWKKPVPKEFRTAVATFDGHSWIWPFRPRTADDLRITFKGMERSDVGKWWFQVLGADIVCYPSKLGTISGEGTQDFCRWEYKEYTESLEALFKAGVNPLAVAREEARKQAAEFHVMIRPAGWGASYPWDEIFRSKFFVEHPEWRCVDRDGTPTLFMSYAYPEVRKRVLDILAESLELRPDGVGFLFHRGMPMMLWEQPVCDLFKSKYGEDAREVAEDDPRLLDLRAEMMTTVLREVRTLLDETAKRQGRATPYKITLATFSKEADNRKFGFDIRRWAREGLVDDLGPAFFAHHTSFQQPDMKYYMDAIAGTKVTLHPLVIAWHSGAPKQLCTRVTEFYKAGVDGICCWDPQVEKGYRDKSPGHVFDVVRMFGHRDVIAQWAKEGVPLPLVTPLKRMGDNYYSRWFPNTGY
jgi:hypothetical protein